MIYTFNNNFNHVLRFNFVTSKRNPYAVLGLKPNATLQDIKKAFRNIAHLYHPDKNPDPKAKQIFVQAKQAYQILTDQDKKRQYDSQSSGNYGGARGYGFDKNPFDQFSDDIFKDKTRTYHDTYSTGSTRKRKGQNITKTIKLTFIQAVKGTKFDLQYQKKGTCPSCNGNRCKPGTAPTRCLSCGGSGSTIFRQDSVVMHLQCSRCKGIGLIIKNPCQTCKATGIMTQNVKQTIQVPPGTQNNQTITLAEKGNHSQSGPNGDLFIKVTVQPHPKFIRKGNDIQSALWLTVSQAALGFNHKIQTIWGQQNIKIPSGTQDGQKIIIKNKGINKIFDIGNHIVMARIQIPTKLTQKQRKIFEQLAKQQSPIKDTQKKSQKENTQNNNNNNQQDDLQNDRIFSKFKDYFK